MTTAVPDIIDKELALESAGGNADLAAELFNMLIKELPKHTESLRSTLDSKDYHALQEVVHKLNGSATYCGVPALKQAAETFEAQLKMGQTGKAEEGVDTLIHEIDRLIEYDSQAVS